MESLLVRELTKISSEVQYSQTTESIYFTVGEIKCRLSDHNTSKTNYDLAIIRTDRGYLTFPITAVFKEYSYHSCLKSLIAYIKQYEHFQRVFKGKAILPQVPKIEMPSTAVIVETPIKEQSSLTLDERLEKDLNPLWLQKSPDIKPMLRKIFTIVPSGDYDYMITKCKSVNALKAQQRASFLANLLIEVTKVYKK